MKQTYFGWFLPIVIVLFPVLGIGGWELLQRYRFKSGSERLDAAVRGFQARAVYIGEEGKPLPLASGRVSPPYFKLQTEALEGWYYRYRSWILNAVFVDSKGLWHPLRVDIQIGQGREVILRSPEVFVYWTDTPPTSFDAEFIQALQGFNYGEGRPHP
jgi:hypothetical protein